VTALLASTGTTEKEEPLAPRVGEKVVDVSWCVSLVSLEYFRVELCGNDQCSSQVRRHTCTGKRRSAESNMGIAYKRCAQVSSSVKLSSAAKTANDRASNLGVFKGLVTNGSAAKQLFNLRGADLLTLQQRKTKSDVGECSYLARS
jgi:hypothetical protein